MRSVAKSLITFLVALLGLTQAQADPLYFYNTREPKGPVRPGLPAEKWDMIEFYGGWARPIRVRAARVKWIKKYIQNELKRDLKEILQSNYWKGARESSLRSWRNLDIIPLPDLIDDITHSKYSSERSCKDYQGKKKEASAELNERNGEICFDPVYIMKPHETWWEPQVKAQLIALALHEHLHHFGQWDADNRIFNQFVALIQYWVRMNIPEPNHVEVTPRFQALRNAFRNALPPTLPKENEKRSWNCGGVEWRDAGINPALEQELMPYVRKWYEMDWKVDGFTVSNKQYWIETPMKSQLDVTKRPLYRIPSMIQTVEVGDEGLWIFDPFAYFSDATRPIAKDPNRLSDWFGSANEYEHVPIHRVIGILRGVSETKMILEVLDFKRETPTEFLPGVFTTQGSAIGYSECNLR